MSPSGSGWVKQAVSAWVCLAAFAGGAASAGETGPPPPTRRAGAEERAVLHLLAPSDAYAAKYDPLAAEAAMRLLALELAARYRIYARFWPVEQWEKPFDPAKDEPDTSAGAGEKPTSRLGTLLPPEAYPRLTAAYVPRPARMKHLRLERRGDVFLFSASADGRNYHPLGRFVMRMPRRTFVGIAVSAMPNKRHLTARLSEVRLDGRPFTGYKRFDFGRTRRPSEVDEEQGVFTFRTYGATWQRDFRGTGPMLYRECDGDFRMEAAVDEITPTGRWEFAGVVCRGALDPLAPMIGTVSDGEEACGASRFRTQQTLSWHPPDGTHLVRFFLETAPGRRREILRLKAAWWTWEDLAASIEGAAEGVMRALAAEGVLRMDRPAPASDPAADERRSLARARALALRIASDKVLAASRLVDAVLEKRPTCAAVHRRAALCGAMLACQEPFGYFHDRGRFLAGPMAHLILARRLAPAASAEEKLDEAWVRFAAGYPNAAARLLATLPREARSRPEAKALRMFITRDYRPLTPETVFDATPLEQAAWSWALRACGRTVLAGEAPEMLAEALGSPAPASAGSRVVSPGSSTPAIAPDPALVYARCAADLLQEPELPAATRRSAGRRMARALGAEADADIPQLSVNISARLLEQKYLLTSVPDRSIAALSALMDLFAAALRRPVGPRPVPGARRAFRWRCLPPRDFADLERGLLLLSLFEQTPYILEPGLGEVFRSMPAAGAFFRGYLSSRRGDTLRAAALFQRIRHTRFVRNPPAVHVLALRWTKRFTYRNKPLQEVVWETAGRGSWEWMLLAQAGGWVFRTGGRTHVSGWMSMAADDHAGLAARFVIWQEDGAATVQPLIQRMAYNPSLLSEAALTCVRVGQLKHAEDAARKLVALAPEKVSGYWWLAWALRWQGRRREAIEAVRAAADQCEASHSLARLQRQAVDWLIEEGRATEALEMADEAAAGGHFPAKLAHARALEAAGRRDEALEESLDLARTGVGMGSYNLARVLADQRRPRRTVRRTLQDLLASPEMLPRRPELAWWLCMGFCRAGAVEALADAFKGPLSFVPRAEQESWLLLCALSARRYREAVAHARALAALRALKSGEVLWAYAAARLGRNREDRRWVHGQLQKFYHDRDLRYPCRYALGRIGSREMIANVWSAAQQMYAHWLAGVEAEERGDRGTAATQYAAAWRRRWFLSRGWARLTALCDRWNERLQTELGKRVPVKPGAGRAEKP